MAQLLNAASSAASLAKLHALSGLRGLKEEFGKVGYEYDLLEFDDVDGNIKMIGDRIIEKIRKDYIDSNPNNTPEKIKAQIKLDTITIYYENSGDRTVKKNIKEKVCQAWYSALRTRNTKILKDIVFLLNKEDVSNTTEQSGGFGTKDLLKKMQDYKKNPQLSGLTNDNSTPDSLDSAADALKNLSSNGMPIDPEQFSNTLSEPQELSEKEQEEQMKTKEKNNLYLEKLIEYKSKLFEVENFEKRPLNRSATVSQVYDLHESVISKILCNYAVINRDILVGELRKIILGNKAIKEMEGGENDQENDNSEEKDSVYQSFITKMQDLGNLDKYSDKSSPTERPPPEKKEDEPENEAPENENEVPENENEAPVNENEAPANENEKVATEQKGGKVDKRIPEYIPSTYIWEKIRGYVEERLQSLIQEKMSLNKENTEGIKKGFQEVFLQANCDSLDLISDKNDMMTDMMNKEYHTMLDYLCKNIPDKYAAPILQSYILRNFEEFTKYLATIFEKDVGVLESFFLGYKNVPSKMFNDKNVTPVYPEIHREDVPADADYDALDNCCNDREGDKDLDATGVSEFIQTKNIGKEQSIKDRFTPSILLPAFNVFKREFNECSENVDFLAILFNMYSGKSIKFMQQIQQQFSHNGVNEFIERYILTKHPYTTKIISECIKHVSDIKLTLSKMVPKQVDEDGDTIPVDNSNLVKLVSQYAAFLMHSGSDISLKIDTSVQNAHTNYIETQIPIFSELCAKYSQESNLLDIREGIIGKIPPQETSSYNKALRRIFSANKSISNSAKRFTKKVRVDLGAKKRYFSSLFGKKPESKETTSEPVDDVNETAENSDNSNPPVAEESNEKVVQPDVVSEQPKMNEEGNGSAVTDNTPTNGQQTTP